MVLEQLQSIFRQVFDAPALVISEPMTAGDVEKWDSLSHIKLIVAVEKHFGVKFKNAEIARMRCVADLCKLVNKYRPDLAKAA